VGRDDAAGAATGDQAEPVRASPSSLRRQRRTCAQTYVLTFMSNRVVRRIFEILAAMAFLGWVVSLLTPLHKSWEWLVAAGSLIILYVCVRVVFRLASCQSSVERLNSPDRKL